MVDMRSGLSSAAETISALMPVFQTRLSSFSRSSTMPASALAFRRLASTPWSVQDSPSSLTDRKSTRLNSSHLVISYAVFCLKKKKIKTTHTSLHEGLHDVRDT